MTCIMMPWEQFLQFAIIAFFFLAIAVGILMYLDGYWTPERVYQRWLRGNSFLAIDARHRMTKEFENNG